MPEHVIIRRWWRRALISAGLLIAVFATYKLSPISHQKTIRLTINGQVYRFATDAPNVQTALDQAGVIIDREDYVAPALTTVVEDGDTVAVWKAHVIALEADGQVIHVRTQFIHPLDILAEQHITVDPADVIRLDGRDFSPDQLSTNAWESPAQHIAVLRHVSITIIEHKRDGDRQSTMQTTQTDVGRALAAAGIDLYLADRVTPDLSTPVTDGLIVDIVRSVPVTITVDGRTLDTRATGPTVGDGLAGLGVALIGEDYTIPAEDTPLEPNLAIRVVRVTETIVFEREPVPCEPMFQPDTRLAPGTRRTLPGGQPGEHEIAQRVRYEDGIEIARTLVYEQIIVPPTPCIVLYGIGPIH